MLTITTNNLVSLDDRYVGRIDKRDAQPTRKLRPVRFYTGEGGTFNTLHEISAPLYIGGPSDWTINPAFEAEVRKIVA